MKTYKIALLPGDGIGRDVTAAAWAVLVKAAQSNGFSLDATSYPWSCDYYLENGSMMPADGIETLRSFDAILLGAVGWPRKVPDSVSLHGLLLPIRKAFVQYANIRPHRLLPGVQGPLRSDGFDIFCIRENTEGEYSGAGGRVHQGADNEVAVETSIFTRKGVERILRFGFEQARARSGKLASVTKSNAQKYSMVFWDEITQKLSAEYPDVEVTSYHIDAMAARMVMAPDSLDVVVASNLFGDILTDLGAAIQGGARLCSLRQYQSRSLGAIDVRTGPRLRARYRSSRHRQSDRRHLVGRDDARAFGRSGCRRKGDGRNRGDDGTRHRRNSRQGQDGRDHGIGAFGTWLINGADQWRTE
ncbi:tartrate dehydrogenase/decarboxylase/D-malate dehydrogenase [Rhizobium leguminosarum]